MPMLSLHGQLVVVVLGRNMAMVIMVYHGDGEGGGGYCYNTLVVVVCCWGPPAVTYLP